MSKKESNRVCYISMLSKQSQDKVVRKLNSSLFKNQEIHASPIQIEQNRLLSDVLDMPEKQIGLPPAQSQSTRTRKEESTTSVMFYLKQREIQINLLTMAMVTMIVKCNFYLVQYLTTTFD